jgi:[protein-PII] uridylyltransferase
LALRAAAASAKLGLPIAPITARHLAGGAVPGAPWPAAALEALTQLLATGGAQIAVWEALDQAGLVTRWIPGWDQVRNRPQRNAIHRHTVDRHLIQTAAGACAFLDRVARPRVLLLAALLHDLGKRPGERDHAAAGAALMPGVTAALGVPADDSADIELLVREHLALAELATTRDLADPATAAELADRVEGRAEMLDLLRALTQADAEAAGPKAWTAWRATLVDRLTELTRARLARGL